VSRGDHHTGICRQRRRKGSGFGVVLLVILGCCFIYQPQVQAQAQPGILITEQADQTPPEVRPAWEAREHAPTRAAMLSAVLPGMGQVYNGRIWKVPIIYIGFGAVAYAINFNSNEYQFWRNAYVAKVDGNPNTIDIFPNIPENNLLRAMNFYRRNLEISYIAGGVLYLLNILDASVDAHLLDFDVGEDLSMRMEPHVTPVHALGAAGSAAPGLKLTFRF
jgi:hypothetical protein